MIQANELRIGNWVADYFRQPIKVGIGVINYLLDANKEQAIRIKPIPLTEEILLKCNHNGVSFTSDPQESNASKAYKFGNVVLHQPNENENYFIIQHNEHVIGVYFLHELQNWCKILNKKELEIKF